MTTAARSEAPAELCRWPTRESVDQTLRHVRHVASTARDAAEDAAGEAALKIRRHPLRAVAVAVAAGAVAGALVGFGTAWFARSRR